MSGPSASVLLLRARWIVPVSSPPIENGWIRVEGDQILEVGRGSPPAAARDLGDVAVLPGLVNAHTHLEFSDCATPIGTPGMPLSTWIRSVIASRATATPEAKAAAILQGIDESRNAGVRLIGEITTTPCDYPPPDATESETNPLDWVTFAEVIGLDPRRAEERLDQAIAHVTRSDHGALSPHAPYSTLWETIEKVVAEADRLRRPVAMHVAEAADERMLLEQGTGPFAEALRELGVWREDLFPWPATPVRSLIELLGRAPRGLLIHGNDLRAEEIEALVRFPRLSVVYCPRTHAYFGHPPHPVDSLRRAGVRVALGTDSRASNPDLNLWNEVRWLLAHRQDLDPSFVLRMATLDGAEAFGRSDLGRIEAGGRPGLHWIASAAGDPSRLGEDLAEGTFRPVRLTTPECGSEDR